MKVCTRWSAHSVASHSIEISWLDIFPDRKKSRFDEVKSEVILIYVNFDWNVDYSELELV